MALGIFPFLCSCILLFALFCNAQQSSTFGFIKNLQGSQKGDSPENLYRLKLYLKQFGYMNIPNSNIEILESNNNANINDDTFDESLESAIKTYQLNHNIEPTGILDDKTVTMMMMPRCGVSDFNSDGRTRMRAGRARSMQQQHHLSTVSHYKLYPNNPKWPKPDLTYSFAQKEIPPDRREAISRAFDKWTAATNNYFKFTRLENGPSDITISFFSKDHGDSQPFDGVHGVLAHSDPPTGGALHFDADEQWSAGGTPKPEQADLETVALHELGHILGLDHSSVDAAIMFPNIYLGAITPLHPDDIQGMKDLYKLP